jgi:DNA-binding transcriptional LysR family regulator
MDWSDRAGQRISLRHLHILMAVAQAGSIAKAAAALSISHPVVSKTVTDLEQVLGVKLLERSSRGVEPTIYGKACLDCGTAVFDELRRGIANVKFLSDPTGGEVRVGASEPMMLEFVPSVVERLARKHPLMTFHATLGIAKELHGKLRAREVDLIISRRFRSLDDDLSSDVVFHEKLFAVCGRTSRWATRRKVVLAELLGEPWVMPAAGNIIAPFVAEAFRASGLEPPRGQVVADSLFARARIAASGHFLTILPGSTLQRGIRHALRILPVPLQIEAQPVEVITLKNRMLNPAAALFVKALHAAAKLLGRAAS